MKIYKNINEWKLKKIDDLFFLIGGGTPSTIIPEYWGGNIHWISIKELTSKNSKSSEKMITKLGLKNSSSNLVKAGNIILGTRISVGETLIHEKDVTINQDLKGLYLKNSNYNAIFFKFLISNNKKKLNDLSNGLTVKGIKNKDLKNFVLKYPDFIQQNNIAKILSKQEEQIETIKRLIKNVEKRNQYYSEKLLSGELKLITNEDTGQIEFHENTEWKEIILNGNIIKSPLDWEISIFSSYSKFTVGTPIHSNNFNYEKKGLMYLRTGDVWKDASSSKDIAYYDGEASLKFIKKENDYLISLKGYNKKIGEGTLGLVTNFNKQIGIVCDNMYLVTPKENDLVAYTAYVTRMPYIQNIILKSAVGSTARFATKMIDKIEWIFPKNIKYMLSVNQFFQKLDNEVFLLEELQKKEEKRFQWMLDNLLSGEYEVIDED